MTTKEHVLSLLENKRGQNISGAHIASQLNMSRNAVWKAVKELKKDGYKIKAVTNKGYCLCEDNDILSAQGILPFLSHKLQEQVADKIYVHASLESTNKTAKEMAISGAEHGTIVIADHQTAGKGRYGRTFHSPPSHGIYMSIILHPSQLCIDTPGLVTHFAAVSVCEAIEAISEKKPKIKWVNDIFLDDKKICGILTEAVTDFESGNMQWIVVGIGVNFSTPAEDFPEELRQIAGAIFDSRELPTTRNCLIAEIVGRMLEHKSQYKEEGILDKYKERLVMLGKNVLVTGAGQPYKAVAMGIDNMGCLTVKKDTGEVLALSTGEINVILSTTS